MQNEGDEIMSDEDKRKLQLQDEDSFFDAESGSVVSTTDCTGLVQTPPESVDEVESYTKIYEVPLSKDKINHGLQHE
ncbi:MAG: hypothetical protein K0Q85_934 [Caproiciproducens sp.]|nr:hypothetical protein [Caproiciproducens sp.]